MDLEKFGGRKFILSILILVTTTVLVGLKGSIDPTYAALLVAVLGAFGVTNVMANRDALNAGASEQKASVDPQSEYAANVSHRVDELSARLSEIENAKAEYDAAMTQIHEQQVQLLASQNRIMENLKRGTRAP